MPTSRLKIHFIGIGGIGVSALAFYYLAKGALVTGSDLASSETIEALNKKGVKIILGKHKSSNLSKGVDLVIYSPAVNKENPEYKEAIKLGVEILSYPQALGRLTKDHFTITVSGTHGKSTTTAMLALIMARAGLDPTVIIGTKIKEFNNSNCRVGKSKYLLIEADEHFTSFLNYSPDIAVLNNIEADHLDYYKNLGNIVKTFKKYLSNLKDGGVIVANKDDKNLKKIVSKTNTKFFSILQPEAKEIKKILTVPGQHNVYNALGAMTAARILGIPDKISLKSISLYKGAWRRFDVSKIKSKDLSFTLVSDYAHHPTEVKAAMNSGREKWPKKEVWGVFQPHQHQRTFFLFKDFVKTFNQTPINKLIITDIYDVAGREEKEIKKKVSSKILALAVKNKKVLYISREKVIDYLKNNLPKNSILMVIGAGDIYNLSLYFKKISD
jgi:UDP-N-acetylmuramate--alanine ligase